MLEQKEEVMFVIRVCMHRERGATVANPEPNREIPTLDRRVSEEDVGDGREGVHL